MDPQLGRLRWRCRRGMKELDILLARYVEQCFCGASDEEQAAFMALLDAQDPLIYRYCLGQEQPPARLAAVVERIAGTSPAAR
jgi:antitoxin CptB